MLYTIMEIEDEQDRSLVEQLYLDYEKQLYKLAKGILHDHYDAQDCVHNTIVSVIKYLSKYRESDDVHRANLLMITCRNIAINMYNAKQKRFASSLTIPEDDTDAGEYGEYDIEDKDSDVVQLVINAENEQTIQQIAMKLDPIYRDAIVLKYFFQLSSKEIGEIINTSENNVNLRLSRARKMILKIGGKKLYEIYQG